MMNNMNFGNMNMDMMQQMQQMMANGMNPMAMMGMMIPPHQNIDTDYVDRYANGYKSDVWRYERDEWHEHGNEL